MRAIALAALLALAACTQSPPSAWRDSTAPIASIAVVDATRLAGDWREVASFRAGGPCVLCRLRIAEDGQALESGAGAARLVPAGPGRFRAEGLTGDLAEPWWVLWVDTDYRTLVLGTPSGRIGLILDRGKIGPDRMKAARDILDWAGYDLAQLKPAGF